MKEDPPHIYLSSVMFHNYFSTSTSLQEIYYKLNLHKKIMGSGTSQLLGVFAVVVGIGTLAVLGEVISGIFLLCGGAGALIFGFMQMNNKCPKCKAELDIFETPELCRHCGSELPK